MRTRIHKISRSGMVGRKKDTLLLMMVILMSFFFSILAIVLQGSFQRTRDAQRLQLYGSWHAAYLMADDDVMHRLEQEPQVSAIGKSHMLNTSSNIGIIGTYNQELIDMGEFKLTEGKFPEKPGEILLETSKVAAMGLNDPIGKEVNIIYEFVLDRASEQELDEYKYNIYLEQEEKLRKEPEEDIIPRIKEQIYREGYWFDIPYDIENLTLDEYITYALYMMRNYKHRTIDWEYPDNDITLTLSNLYHINYYEGETPGPDEIRDKGILEESILRVNVKYTVCGVISDYSDRWDVSYYSLPNAFISEETYNELENIVKNTELADTADYQLSSGLNLFMTSDELGADLFKELAPKYLSKEELEQATGYTGEGELAGAISSFNINFRKNGFAYPVMEGSTEATLLIIILTIIFIATVVSVFQIFLSQIKRRSRKIALLKSIGATNGQIIGMMAWEGIYLLLVCLPIGALSGLGLSYVILQIIRLVKDSIVIYYVDFGLLGLGLIAGIVSVIIGMMVPAIYAAGTPLIGTMSKPPKQNIQKYRKQLIEKQERSKGKRQSFNAINLRHVSLNKGKVLLNLVISAITISILITSVFICYMAFTDYNKAVAIPNRPDYTMEIPYGVDDIYIVHYSSAIEKIPGIKSVNGYRRGEYLHLYHENVEKDETVSAFYQIIPTDLAGGHFGPGFADGKAKTKEYGLDVVDKALIVNMYGIDTGSDFGKTVMNSISEGKLDKDAFNRGDEVILVLPHSKKGNTDSSVLSSSENISELRDMSKYSRMKWLLEKEDVFKFSLDRRYKNIYQKNDSIKVGDTITISANEEIQMEDNIITSYTPYEVKVGAIISYFPKNNVWPFSDTSESYGVIASSDLFEKLYKASTNGLVSGGGYGNNNFVEMITTIFHNKFGKTVFHIYGDSKADRIKTDIRMIEFASALNAKLYNYRENNQMLYTGALNNALIMGLLGFCTSVVAIFILYNILSSTAIQEKQRIGILQSIGVTNRQLARLQIKTGLVFSIISLAIAHVIVVLVMFLTPFGKAAEGNFTTWEYIQDVFGRLQMYPWLIHILVCIAFTVVTAFIYYISTRKIIKQSPIENMRI